MAGQTCALFALCIAALSWSCAADFTNGAGYSLNCSQVLAAVDDLRSAILSQFKTDEDGRPYRALIGGFVRLAFHISTGGKCKGCINLDDRNNIHLDQYVSVLEQLYVKYNTVFSRGDFWALASIVALRESEKITNQLLGRSFDYMLNGLQFRYGRVDCSLTSPLTTDMNELPIAEGGIDQVLQYFADNFGFDMDEVVVIMGAHKLGGFRNPLNHNIFRQWASPPDTLTNEYYRNMQNDSHGWNQVSVAPCSNCKPVSLFQNVLGKRLMFNVDMSLRKNLTFANGVSSFATYNVATCPDSDTLPAFQFYAYSDDYWEERFATVFTKMIEVGYAGRELHTLRNCSYLN